MTPLLGFTPDAPTTTEGITLDCAQWIPYESGFRAAPSPVDQGASALAAGIRGAATLRDLSGATRVIVGTNEALYSLSGTTFTDQSKVGGYSLGSGDMWSIVQFGNKTYASSLDDVIQVSSGTDFDDVGSSDPPAAKILVSMMTSAGGFLVAMNVETTADGAVTDGVINSAVNDGDDWDIDPTNTLCNKYRLLGENGPITAGAQLGSDLIIAYKNRSIYVGTVVGAPTVIQWREIPSVGCVGQFAIVDLGTVHFFLGEDNFYLFDGARPIPVGSKVRQWFLDNSSVDFRSKTQMVYERDANLVRIYFASTGSSDGTLDRCLVYHVVKQEWGLDHRTVEFAFTYSNPSADWNSDGNSWDTDTTTWDQEVAGTRVTAIFNSSHVMQLLNGAPGASYFTLHDIGNDNQISLLDAVTLRYMAQPATSTVTSYSSMATGGVPAVGATQAAFDVPSSTGSIFRLRQTARWHRLQFNFTGNCRVSGYEITGIKAVGLR